MMEHEYMKDTVLYFEERFKYNYNEVEQDDFYKKLKPKL